ncbi:MAG: hypothetical protein JSS16_14035 [Proteobacteria bacterium]|uniref:hypothetical protein n=1 Tax=Rudaea sp. TaxID=2136325 RepID=UPI001D2C3DEC|nr:hypothetical protein [Pseudomonadota bacterium]
MTQQTMPTPPEADARPAGFLVNLFGLLADFLFLREGQTRIDLYAFLAWLRRHQHADQAQRIEADPALLDAIRNALAEGHGEIITRLEAIDEALLHLCEPPGPFATVARTARPDLALRALRT